MVLNCVFLVCDFLGLIQHLVSKCCPCLCLPGEIVGYIIVLIIMVLTHHHLAGYFLLSKLIIFHILLEIRIFQDIFVLIVFNPPPIVYSNLILIICPQFTFVSLIGINNGGFSIGVGPVMSF